MKIENQKWAGGKFLRSQIVVAGIVLGQAILYGPSLIGQRILLPLDLLARRGMYLFCRQTLRVRFWPAAVCAWCYPLTAFFVLWQGSAVPLPVCWLPWIFLCVDKIARGGGALPIVGLSVATFLVLTSGGIDIA